MSKATMTATKADGYLQRYLDMGPDRSIRRLATELQRTDSGGGSPPPERTLFRWSAQYGWDRQAKQFDQEVAERAKRQLLQRRADMAQTRMDIALDTALGLHSMVRSAMTIEDEESTGNPDGPIMRPRNFNEMSNSDIYAMLALLNTARAIDNQILGTAAAVLEQYEEQRGQAGPEVTVLGKEAVQEIGMQVGKLVRQLARTTEARRAAREQEAIDQWSDEPEFESADDPNLQWEEIPDDE